MSASSQRTFLRPEARPFGWAGLNESQKSAFGKIVNALVNAITAIDESSHPNTEIHFDENRSNRAVLLSGDRGTGKTSLMLSLQHALIPNSNWSVDPDDESWKQISKQLDESQLASRVVWLETLDMEPLPGPTNLLVAILARIERAIGVASPEFDSPVGLLNPQASSEEAQIKLRQLATDASLAWDGNIRERAASLDPDTFAHEVMRAENSRLSLNSRLHDILNGLAASVSWGGKVSSPMFVLPVDDFDLNPVRCLDLLRLLRAITAPRLFTLVLGDISVAEKTFKLRIVGDFARVADVHLDAPSLYHTPFFTDVGSMSANALRKLLPPAQRILLKNLKVTESLKYRPNENKYTPTLSDVLREYTMELELPYFQPPEKEFADTTVKNAADVILENPIARAFGDGKDGERYIYGGVSMLEGPPREIADLWFTVANCPKTSTNRRKEFIELVRDWFNEAIVNDPNLPHKQKEELKESIVELTGGEVELRTDVLGVQWGKSPARRWVEVEVENLPQQSFQFFPQRSRRMCFSAHERQDGQNVSSLARHTESYLTLLHDLIALSPNAPIVGRWIVPTISSFDLASVMWQSVNANPQVISWPGAVFRSFWELDRFFHAWNSALDGISTTKPWTDEVPTLAAHWLAAGASILLGEKYPWKSPPKKKLTKTGYDALLKQVSRLVDDQRYGRWRRSMSLKNYAVLLAPECGIPLEFSERFWIDETLSSFWMRHVNDIRRLRADFSAVKRQQVVPDFVLLLVSPRRYFEKSNEEISRLSNELKNDEQTLQVEFPGDFLRIGAKLAQIAKDLSRPEEFDFNSLVPIRDELQSYANSHAILKLRLEDAFTRAANQLNALIHNGPFGIRMLHHPANAFENGALCPTEHELLR